MVLTRPVTKTKISTVDFGHPVYDILISLQNQMQGFKAYDSLGLGGTWNSGATIASINIPAAPVARWVTIHYHALISLTGAGGDAQLYWQGAMLQAYRFPSQGTNMAEMTRGTLPLAANVAAESHIILNSITPGATTFADPNFHLISYSSMPQL